MRRGVDYHTRPVSLDRAAEILRIETARGGVLSRLLFPGWSQRTANQLIHLAAKRFEWDEDFKWDGAHTLRHGAAEEAAERAAKLMRVLQVTGGWDSTSAPLGYAGGVRGKPPGGGVWPRQPL